ncbi:MAG: hypothetical protein JST54_01665 [Deltaproteobacteria bacterium]|nr:hypothetical protein [Deltaproteobacteria bacterium]
MRNVVGSVAGLMILGWMLTTPRSIASGRALAATPAVPLTCGDALQGRSPASVHPVEVSVSNDSATRLELMWMNFRGQPKSYGFIAPHETRALQTYAGHVWVLEDPQGKCTRAFAAGEPAVPARDTTPVTWNSEESNGITYVFASKVSGVALQRAKYIVDHMLEGLPAIRASMAKRKFKVEIIAKDQVLSDLPDYASLKGKRTRDGRDFDTGTRGLGGEEMCSIGEENLLCLSEQPYRDEDIFIHEFSHSIKSNLAREDSAAIDAAFEAARDASVYPSGIYMIRDSQEYWAEGTQVFFAATRRSDVNGGFNTRERLQAHDPRLFELLQRIYDKDDVAPAKGCRY